MPPWRVLITLIISLEHQVVAQDNSTQPNPVLSLRAH